MKKIAYCIIILTVAGLLLRCVADSDFVITNPNQADSASSVQPITLINTATPISVIDPISKTVETISTSIPATPLPTFTPTPSATVTPAQTATPTATPLPQFHRLTHGDCCTAHSWVSDSEIRFIDQHPQTGQTGLWAINIDDIDGSDGNISPKLIEERMGVFSPNLRYFAYPDPTTGLAVIEDQETGEAWSLNLNGSPVNFSPESDRIVWIEIDRNQPFETRTPEFWIADVNGDNAKRVASLPRTSALSWSDRNTLLIAKLENRAADSQFAIRDVTVAHLSLLDGSIYPLFRVERPREVSMNEAKTAIVFFTALAENPVNNGIWYADITTPHVIPEKLPILGAYKWRDNQTLIYIPFNPQATHHVFHTYNVITGEDRQITDSSQMLATIANNDWTISPDGNRIVFLATNGETLDGLWLVDLAP